jgi:hypothetical protein
MTRDQEKTERKIQQLAQRADAEGIEQLKPDERVAVVAYWARGAISNGGLRSFFQSSVRLDTLVSALRSLGLTPQAEAALSAAALFPDPAMADQPALRAKHWQKLNTDEQDNVFFQLGWEQLYDAIAAYWRRV